MDGSLAVIFLLTSLTEMGLNDCQNGGCLDQSSATSRVSVQAAQVFFQEEEISQELYVGYDMDRQYGPFQPTFGASVTSDNAFWFGAGVKWTTRRISSGPFFFETSLMSGLFEQGDDPHLGGNLQFRSAVGGGYTFDNGATLAVLYDHRSNADTNSLNPGLETLSVRYAFVIN